MALPANEIFIPILLMIYNSGGALTEVSGNAELLAVLSANGWTAITALSVVILTLFHFPCATTLMTIKKESGKLRWAIVAAVLPTVIGLVFCLIINILSITW